MAKKSIVICDKEFKYQKDALTFFKDMLSRYRNNQTITDDDHEL